MVRQYKETPRPAGVFRVRHTPTGRTLVGSSPDVPAMLNRIRAQLRMKGHPNRELQRDWDNGDPSDFEFDVLDLVEQGDQSSSDVAAELEGLEAMWREELGLLESSRY